MKRIPGIPGRLGEIGWADALDYGGNRARRQVDPAPLARLLAVHLRLIEGSARASIKEITEDSEDGPVHIARLFAALAFAVREIRLRDYWLPQPDPKDPVGAIRGGLREDGLPGAADAIRAMDPREREELVRILVGLWMLPLTALDANLAEQPGRYFPHY